METRDSMPVPVASEGTSPSVEQSISEEQVLLRANKLQLAWALFRSSTSGVEEAIEEKMGRAMAWLNTEEGMAVSDWFRKNIMNYQNASGEFTQKNHFLSQITDDETKLDVSDRLLAELDSVYRGSLH